MSDTHDVFARHGMTERDIAEALGIAAKRLRKFMDGTPLFGSLTGEIETNDGVITITAKPDGSVVMSTGEDVIDLGGLVDRGAI